MKSRVFRFIVKYLHTLMGYVHFEGHPRSNSSQLSMNFGSRIYTHSDWDSALKMACHTRV